MLYMFLMCGQTAFQSKIRKKKFDSIIWKNTKMAKRLGAVIQYAETQSKLLNVATRKIHLPLVWNKTNPAHQYIKSLDADESKMTMMRVLHRVAHYMGLDHLDKVPWSEIDSHHVNHVLDGLKQAKLSPNTVGLYLTSIREVSRHAFLLEQMPVAQYTRVKEIRRPRGSRVSGAGKPLEPDVLQAVIEDCTSDPSPAGKRDLAIIGLLYGAGLRRHELAKLTLHDNLDFREGLITIIGKGNKERIIPMPDVLSEWLHDYIEVRGDKPGPFIYRLQITKNGLKLLHKGVTGQAIYDVCIKRGANIDCDERHTPHDYRRTYGTELNENKHSIKEVSELLGHTSIATTQTYVRVRKSTEERKRTVNTLSFGGHK
jgi:site-specific recombinase XerC